VLISVLTRQECTNTISIINAKELKVRGSSENGQLDDSPENLIIPYEDINTKEQKTIRESS